MFPVSVDLGHSKSLISLNVFLSQDFFQVKAEDWTPCSLEFISIYTVNSSEPHSSVGSVVDLRTGAHLFDPRLSQYSF